MIKADIFIPTSKNLPVLDSCLKQLSKQTYRSFRVLLVAKESDRSVKRLIEKYSRLKIVYFVQKKPGLANAAIEALEKSRAEIFVRIDDDVEVTQKWLQQMIITFDQDKQIGAVTGPTLVTSEGLKARDSIAFLSTIERKNFIARWIIGSYLYENRLRAVGEFLRSGNFTVGANFRSCLRLKKNIEVDNVEACNFACRTKLLKKIGGFDPLFSRGLGEYHEADAGRKIIENRYRVVFNPRVVVWHRVEHGGQTLSRPDSYYRIFNFIIFYRKHFAFKTADQILRFTANVTLQNMYYVYKFFSTGNTDHLSSIMGTVAALSFRL